MITPKNLSTWGRGGAEGTDWFFTKACKHIKLDKLVPKKKDVNTRNKYVLLCGKMAYKSIGDLSDNMAHLRGATA